MITTLYLLHLSAPVSNRFQHYVGITSDLDRRMRQHRSGRGAGLLKKATAQGIDFVVVVNEDWQTRQEALRRERQIKKGGNYAARCPICKGKKPADAGRDAR